MKNKWINVKDEMPNFYNDVFLLCKDGYCVVGFASEKNGKFLGFKENPEDEFYLKNVLYWQPVIFPYFTQKLLK